MAVSEGEECMHPLLFPFTCTCTLDRKKCTYTLQSSIQLHTFCTATAECVQVHGHFVISAELQALSDLQPLAAASHVSQWRAALVHLPAKTLIVVLLHTASAVSILCCNQKAFGRILASCWLATKAHICQHIRGCQHSNNRTLSPPTSVAYQLQPSAFINPSIAGKGNHYHVENDGCRFWFVAGFQ